MSVKKQTNYLVIGKITKLRRNHDEKTTIKYRRAKELQEKGIDIKLLPEQDFYDLLRESI